MPSSVAVEGAWRKISRCVSYWPYWLLKSSLYDLSRISAESGCSTERRTHVGSRLILYWRLDLCARCK